jgi:hypothetical protein
MHPTLALVDVAQSCDGAYINKGGTNNQEQKYGKKMTKKKLPKLSSFPWIIVKLGLFWHIIVDQVTIYNYHGQRPWCNCLSDKKIP